MVCCVWNSRTVGIYEMMCCGDDDLFDTLNRILSDTLNRMN